MRLIALFCFLIAFAGAWAQWTVTTLTTPGDLLTRAYAIDGDWIVGEARVEGGDWQACMWNRTTNTWVSLHPAGATYSTARGVHNGQQVGWAIINGVNRAMLWTGTAASAVDLTPAGATESEAFGVQNGKQVGRAIVNGSYRASLWSSTAASWVDMNPPGCDSGLIYAIDNGQQAGVIGSGTGIPAGAVIWSGTANSAVTLAGPNNSSSRVYGMGGGQQVGDGGTSSFVWSGSAPSGTGLSGHSPTSVFDCAGGFQVGEIRSPGFRAAVWRSAYNLTTFLPMPAGSGRTSARGIWQSGSNSFVVGWSLDSVRALLWTGPLAPADDFSFTLSKTMMAGANHVRLTIISATTFPQDERFRVYCDQPGFDWLWNYMTLPAGQTTTSMYLPGSDVYVATLATFGVERGSVRKTQTLLLMPLAPSAMMFTPNPVTGGQNVQCRVVLNGRLGVRPFVLNLSDDSGFAMTPPTVTVPFNSTEATFNIQTLPVATRQTVRVTISNAYGTVTGTFRINP